MTNGAAVDFGFEIFVDASITNNANCVAPLYRGCVDT